VNDNIKQIRVKNDGKRVKSLFKYGLEFIAYYLNNPLAIIKVDIFNFCHVLSKNILIDATKVKNRLDSFVKNPTFVR
jgi:hypothetical protein